MSRPITFPCLKAHLVPIDQVRANDYNPNHVARPEMELLRQSIEADGVTQPIVVYAEGEHYVIVDGFHRFSLVRDHFGSEVVPVVVIDKALGDRMASTIRHNRARGKHGIELMAALVKDMLALEWSDAQIASALGMSDEELLRLRQIVGAAKALASETYSRSWGNIE